VKRALAVTLLGVAATGLGGQAHAQDPEGAAEPQYTFVGSSVQIVDGSSTWVVELGCQGRAALRIGAKLLIACGSAGVVQIDIADPTSPHRDGAMQVDGDATALFLRDGRVWVEISHVDARPLRIESEQVSTTTTAAPIPEREAPPGPEASAPPEVPRESPSLMAPPRRANLWEMSLETSAFIAIGSLGAGVLGSASVAYRFDLPFVVRAEVAPFGIAGPSTNNGISSASGPTPLPPGGSSGGTTSQPQSGTVSTGAAHLLAGIDTEFIEVALGFGAASVNQNTGGGTGTPDTSALSIAESARIGARDGLALNMESSIIGANHQFNLGYFVSSIQIPLSRTTMLVIRGGGGPVGFAYGDVGVRALVRGNGGPGTVALTGFAGGASIMVDLCSTNTQSPFTESCNNSSLGGPSLGGAVEWKL
jgi:hypothetical protein